MESYLVKSNNLQIVGLERKKDIPRPWDILKPKKELDDLDEVDALVEMASEIEDRQSNIGYIKTSEGFDVRLPKESIETIARTIEMTPHEGFKPVVRVNMLGQIVLDFEPL